VDSCFVHGVLPYTCGLRKLRIAVFLRNVNYVFDFAAYLAQRKI
jgi:hypothetical protein